MTMYSTSPSCPTSWRVQMWGQEEVLGLEVPVDDAFSVRRRQPPADLHPVVDHLARGQRTRFEAAAQGLAFKQLEDDVVHTII
jgi:hypothetical protein